MSYNGTIVGSPTFVAGRFGQALAGVDDNNYVQVPMVPAILGTAWTIDVTLSTTAASGNNVAVSWGNAGQPNVIWLGVAPNGNFEASASGIANGSQVNSGIAINDGNPHRCRAVLSGGTLYLFVDGVLGTTATGVYAPPALGNTGCIGRLSFQTGNAWVGNYIDEVAVFSAALTTASYTPGSSAYTGAEANLAALYHLDGDANDAAGGSSGANTVAPNHAALLYSPGNWDVNATRALSINPGAYLRTIFSGTACTLSFDISALSSSAPLPQLWITVDGVRQQYAVAATIQVATGLASRNHSLEVLFRSESQAVDRWGGALTAVRLTGLTLDQGAALTAPVRRTHTVWLYGDSITEGRAAQSYTDDGDALQAYSHVIATAMDAEVGIIGFSGQGMTVPGASPTAVPSVTSAWNLIASGLSRTGTPDLIVVNHGTNDSLQNVSASTFIAAFTTQINAWLAAFPGVRIVVAVPFGQYYAASLAQMVTAIGDPRVTLLPTAGWFTSVYNGDLSLNSQDDIHPWGAISAQLGTMMLPGIVLRLYPLDRRYSFS